MDLFNISMSTMWVILFAVFVVAELVTAGGLVSIWFCFGSLAAVVAARAGTGLITQVAVFLVVSIALLFITKPFVTKVLKQKNEPTNYDTIIGHVGVVVEAIDNIAEKGAVKIDGKLWTARTMEENITIVADTKVRIIKIQGVKVYVEQV